MIKTFALIGLKNRYHHAEFEYILLDLINFFQFAFREGADRTYYAEKRLSVEYDEKRSEFFNVFFDWLEKPKSQEEFT